MGAEAAIKVIAVPPQLGTKKGDNPSKAPPAVPIPHREGERPREPYILQPSRAMPMVWRPGRNRAREDARPPARRIRGQRGARAPPDAAPPAQTMDKLSPCQAQSTPKRLSSRGKARGRQGEGKGKARGRQGEGRGRALPLPSPCLPLAFPLLSPCYESAGKWPVASWAGGGLDWAAPTRIQARGGF